MSTPAMDPSQVFADPSQMPGMQGAPDAQGPEPQEPPAGETRQEQEPQTVGPPIDLEGSLAHAIEVGCDQAIAATTTSAEDYMRFCQGVSFLAAAIKDIQPPPIDPAHASVASTTIQAAQRHTQAMAQLDAQRQAQADQANRPTPSGPSARG